jgi:predicted DNA binding CopG/RHH family protein
MRSISTQADKLMRDQYDFSNAKRGAVAPAKGKSRITIMLDDAVLVAARERADEQGIGYQTLINGLLRAALGVANKPVPGKERLLTTGSELSLDAFNRQQVEALEAQLSSMANSLHVFLSDGNKSSSA